MVFDKEKEKKMPKPHYDRRIDLKVSLPFDEAREFPRRAKPCEKYQFSLLVVEGKKRFEGRISAKVYRYDSRKAFNGEAQTETDFVDYCEFVEVVETQTHRTNTRLLNGSAQLIFLVPVELRGFVSVDFELFDVKGQKINNDYVYCETNGKPLTPTRIEIENPYVESDEDIHQLTTMPDTFVESNELVEVVDPRTDGILPPAPPPIPESIVKEEEKPKDVNEPEVSSASEVKLSEIPPTDISSAESVHIPPAVETNQASSWYLLALVMALILAFGVASAYFVFIAVTDGPNEETQVAMTNDEEFVGLMPLPMDVPDTQNPEEEIAESVPSVISPVPVRDLEVVSLAMEESDENPMPVQVVAPEPPEPAPVAVVCPNLDDARREKTESYIHAVSALNAEVDLATGQRDDAVRKHEACERELEIAVMATQPADAPVIIVDAKNEEIIPLNFPKRAVKPKGEPLVLEDLEGIPTFDTMTPSEKRIFLRLHNKKFNK